MFSKTGLLVNLAFLLTPFAALAADSSQFQGVLTLQNSQVKEIVRRSQGAFITNAYKQEAQALQQQLQMLNQMQAQDPKALSIRQSTQVTAARIARHMSRRDVCVKGYSSLSDQQCISLELTDSGAGFSAVSAGAKILFMGGESRTGPSAAVNIFDTETNAWSSTNLKTVKGRVGTQAVGNSRAVAYSLNKANSPSLDVEVYDAVTHSWSASSTPTTLTSIRSAAADNRVIFWNYGTPQTTLHVFDVIGSVWSTMAAPTANVWSVSLSGSDRAVFARGLPGAFAKSTGLDIYDPTQNSWSVVDIPASFQAGFTAGIYLNGQAFLVAREKEADFDQTLDRPFCRQKLMVYDFRAQVWSQKFIPGCSLNWSVAGTGGKIVFAADRNLDVESGQDPHKAFVLDVSNERWSTVHLSLTGSSKPIAAARNKILIGSGQSALLDSNIRAEVNVFEVLQNSWTASSPLLVTGNDSRTAIGRLNFVKSADGKLGGWAADSRNPSSPLKVKFFLDGDSSRGKFIGETLANTLGYDNDNDGQHGFVYRIPAAFMDNKLHELYAYAIDVDGNERMLLGSPMKFRALKPGYSPESLRAYQMAFVSRPAFPSSCNGTCHNFTYEDRWIAATGEVEAGRWSTEDNRLIKKMRSGLHNGPPFDETSIRLVKAWLDIEFQE